MAFAWTDFCAFLERSVSPYHAADAAAALLREKGFCELAVGEPWRVERGGRYVVTAYRTMVAAFAVGSEYAPGEGVRIAASHLDWPCFYIKPAPEQAAGGFLKLSVEPYGGMIRNTWMDRPLSVAGLVTLQDGEGTRQELIDFSDPVLTIPNLAIHMNREVNKGVELNPAKDLLPLCACLEEDMNKDGYFVRKLAERLSAAPEDIQGYDLCVYNPEKPALVGFDRALLSAPRLDNITSVYACLSGILSAAPVSGVSMAVLFDHEEIGSGTKQGAFSSVLGMLTEKLALALGQGREGCLDMRFNGFFLSCDVAHALHPNRAEMYDSSCQSLMNRGVALKMNYEQRYATEAEGLAVIEGLCRKHDIPYQRYMNRPDLRGGGTLGSYASSMLGMRAVDIGVPMLAMHSCRELMAARDEETICRLVSAFLQA